MRGRCADDEGARHSRGGNEGYSRAGSNTSDRAAGVRGLSLISAATRIRIYGHCGRSMARQWRTACCIARRAVRGSLHLTEGVVVRCTRASLRCPLGSFGPSGFSVFSCNCPAGSPFVARSWERGDACPADTCWVSERLHMPSSRAGARVSGR